MQNDKAANVPEFIEKARRYTEIKELTPAIVNEFIDYITVEPQRLYRNLMQRCPRTLHFLM